MNFSWNDDVAAKLKAVIPTMYDTYGIGDLVDTFRKEKPSPFIIAGPGRSGKDTLALLLYRCTPLRYAGTSSLNTATLVYAAARQLQLIDEKTSIYSFYEARHQNRMFWFHCLNVFRDYDPMTVPAMSLYFNDRRAGDLTSNCIKTSDLLVGTRSLIEMSKACHYARKAIWLSRPDIDDDPTLEYGLADLRERLGEENVMTCANNGDCSRLVDALSNIVRFLGTQIEIKPKHISYVNRAGLVIGI
jgi:hypothetical protein